MNQQQQKGLNSNGNQNYMNNQFNSSIVNKSFNYSSNPNSRINYEQFENKNDGNQAANNNSKFYYNKNQIGQNFSNFNQSFYAPKNEFKFSYMNNNN